VNRFELAILRILVKRQDSLRVSSVIEGFPDYYLDHVLLAMSNLNYRSYIFFSTYDSVVHISLNADKRREVLEIVDPFSDPQNSAKSEQVDPVAFHHQNADTNAKNKKGKRFFTAIKSPLTIQSAAVVCFFILGSMSLVGVLPAGDNFTNLNFNHGIPIKQIPMVFERASHQHELSKYQWYSSDDLATNHTLFAGHNHPGMNPSSHQSLIADHLQRISYYCNKYRI
jgi:hypothetical protein